MKRRKQVADYTNHTTKFTSQENRSMTLQTLPTASTYFPRQEWLTQIRRCGGLSSKIENCLSFACPSLQAILVLKPYTNEYLRSREQISKYERDIDLNNLIRESDNQLVAFLACVHALSKSEVEMWLKTIRNGFVSSSQSVTYLQILVTVDELNSTVLKPEERKCVENLQHLLRFNESIDIRRNQIRSDGDQIMFERDVEATFHVALDLLEQPSSTLESDLFLSDPLREIPKQFCLHALTILFQMSMPFTWKLAVQFAEPLNHNSNWVSMVIESGNPLVVTEWSAWSSWNPDIQNIDVICRFPKLWRDNEIFKEIFELEGPDFKLGKYSSLLECHISTMYYPTSIKKMGFTVMASAGSIHGLRGIVNMLFQLLDKAAHQPRSPLTRTSALTLVERSIRATINVSEVHIRILFAILDSGVDLSWSVVFENFFISLNNIQENTASDLAHTLACIEISTSLRAARNDFGFLVGQIITQELNKVLEALRTATRCGHDSCDDHFEKVISYIEILRRHAWISAFVEKSTLRMAEFLPSANQIRLIYKFRAEVYLQTPASQGLHALVTTYSELKIFGVSRMTLDQAENEFLDSLLEIFEDCSNIHKILALTVAKWTHIPIQNRSFIIAATKGVSESFCHRVHAAVLTDHITSCVNLARILAYEEEENVSFWTRILEMLISPLEFDILDSTAEKLDIMAWIDWIHDLEKLFDHRNVSIMLTGLLHEPLQAWVKELKTRSSYFTTLSGVLGDYGSLKKQIYTGYKYSNETLPLLDQIGLCDMEIHHMCRFLLLTKPLNNTQHIQDIRQILEFIQKTDVDPKFVKIHRLHSICKMKGQGILACLLLVWWRNPLTIKELDNFGEYKDSFKRVFQNLDTSQEHLQVSISSASQHLYARYEAVQFRMSKLQKIRAILKLHDVNKTTEFMASLGLEDDQSLLYIPETLVNYVDQVDQRTYHLYFPLNDFKELQRLAMGIGNSQSLVVRLAIRNGLSDPTFQVFLDSESTETEDISWISNTRTTNSDELDIQTISLLNRPSRLTYGVLRLLLYNFQNGFDSIEELYNTVQTSLIGIDRCVICQQHLSVRVWQSTTCTKTTCVMMESWRRIQLLEMCPKVLDLFYVSASNVDLLRRSELLPGCPATIMNYSRLSIGNFQSIQPILSSIMNYPDFWAGKQTYELLMYLASFRVFLAEATGVFRIPSLPRVYQYVVCNSSPEVEALRSKRGYLTKPEDTQIVFHGTSIDRLLAILSEGLKTLSGTTLQSHGAAYGSGIYCSTEPAKALSYSAQANSCYNPTLEGNLRLVLGCELVGFARNVTNDGVVVVDDATQLSVRYLFLFPPNTNAPESRFIVPAMKSTFEMLRVGTT